MAQLCALSTKEDTMARLTGRVKGTMTYREGDGVLIEIPHGPCEVEIADMDVTLTWFEDAVHFSTAMPRTDYEHFVANGVLVLD